MANETDNRKDLASIDFSKIKATSQKTTEPSVETGDPPKRRRRHRKPKEKISSKAKIFTIGAIIVLLIGANVWGGFKDPEAEVDDQTSEKPIIHKSKGLSYRSGALATPIPMHLVRGVHPVVKVIVNGHQKLNLLVDTGSNYTLVPKEIFGNAQGSKSVKVKSLCFENSVCFDDVSVRPTSNNYTETRRGYYNGLLGIDLIRRTGLTIDYRNNQIYLGPAPAGVVSSKIKKIKFSMDKSQRPFAKLSIGSAVFPKILLDTGSSFTRYTKQMADQINARLPVKYREMSFTINALTLNDITNLPKLCIDAIACADNVLGQKASWPAVGGTFFRNFLTTFDFKKNELVLRPYDLSSPQPQSLMQRFGLQFHLKAVEIIVWVEPGSIAEKAGISTDDELVELNGVSASTLGYLGVHKILEKPGLGSIEVTLQDADGTKRIALLKP